MEKKSWLQRFLETPPVFIDGGTFVLLAFLAGCIAALGTDEAEHWIEAQLLWYLKSGFSTINGSVLAFKLYRSTGFANHAKEKAVEKEEVKAEIKKRETAQFTRSDFPPKSHTVD